MLYESLIPSAGLTALLYYEMAEVQHDVGWTPNTGRPELEESTLADAAGHGHAAANVRRSSVPLPRRYPLPPVLALKGEPLALRSGSKTDATILCLLPHNNAFSSATWSSTPPLHHSVSLALTVVGEGGAVAAQLEMGLLYDFHPIPDIKTAFPAFSMAPSLLDAEGEQRLEKAAGYYRKALELADHYSYGFDAVGIKAEACYRLGMYAEHRGDKKESWTLYEQAAELGHLWGQFTLAEMIGEQVEGLRASPTLASLQTEGSSRGWDAEGISRFTDMYIRDEVNEHIRRACKWYTKSAEQVRVYPGGACHPRSGAQLMLKVPVCESARGALALVKRIRY